MLIDFIIHLNDRAYYYSVLCYSVKIVLLY